MKISRMVTALIAVALFGAALSLYFLTDISAINFLAGYFSALLVFSAAALGYWQMVQGSAQTVPHHDLPDEMERIDDRFGLWEESSEEIEDASKLLKEEKNRLKQQKRGFKEFLKTTKPALSIYRVVAYAILVYAVYRLISAQIFEPVIYLVGVAVAAFAVVTLLWLRNRNL